MIARPILRPIACLRAVARMTASLTGKTGPASSRASRNAGQQPVGACASASGARTQSGVRRARAISLRPPHRRAAGRRVDLACAESDGQHVITEVFRGRENATFRPRQGWGAKRSGFSDLALFLRQYRNLHRVSAAPNVIDNGALFGGLTALMAAVRSRLPKAAGATAHISHRLARHQPWFGQ